MNHRRDRLPPLLPALALVVLASPAGAAQEGLRILPDWPILLLLLVAFVLLVAPTNALLFRPIFRVLDAREERIAGTRRHAERVAQQAEEVVTRYERAIADAREAVEYERKERVETARREGASDTAGAREVADREIEAARTQLTRARSDARSALRSQAEELAREAAARLLGRTP